jgi:hypothetical protein
MFVDWIGTAENAPHQAYSVQRGDVMMMVVVTVMAMTTTLMVMLTVMATVAMIIMVPSTKPLP